MNLPTKIEIQKSFYLFDISKQNQNRQKNKAKAKYNFFSGRVSCEFNHYRRFSFLALFSVVQTGVSRTQVAVIKFLLDTP